MSIIHDALKRVQANLQKDRKHTAPTGTETSSQETSTAEQPEQSRKLSPVLVIPLALIVLAGSAWFIYQQALPYFPQLKTMVPKDFKGLKSFKLPEKQKDPQPLVKVALSSDNKNTLNVQGVLDNSGQSVALINGKIYEEGDTVSGVKILKIGVDVIRILRNGREEELKVR